MGDRRQLLETLRKAAAPLRGVDERWMFGCPALFAGDAIFALVWGASSPRPSAARIGVKLPDAARFDALAKQKGAEPWRAGPMVMAHWLLVPPALEDATKLAPWVQEAHAMAVAGLGKLKVPKKIRGVAAAKRKVTNMAAKKSAAKSAGETVVEAASAVGDTLAKTPAAARTVAEEVVRAVTKAGKAAKKVVAKAKKAVSKVKAKKPAAKKKAASKPKAKAKKPAAKKK